MSEAPASTDSNDDCQHGTHRGFPSVQPRPPMRLRQLSGLLANSCDQQTVVAFRADRLNARGIDA